MGRKHIDRYETVIKAVWRDYDDHAFHEEEELDISHLYIKDIEHFLDGAEAERNEEEEWERQLEEEKHEQT